MKLDRPVGDGDAVLVIDDTAFAEEGALSIGVAPQYARRWA
jgi:hypothetical protein